MVLGLSLNLEPGTFEPVKLMDLHTVVVVLALVAPFFFGTIWATVNVAQKDFGTMGKKAMWLFIAAIPFVGFIIYLIFGMRKGKISSD